MKSKNTGKEEDRQFSLGGAGGSKDWIQDATRPAPISLRRERRKKPGNAGSEPGTKMDRTIAAFVLAWKRPK